MILAKVWLDRESLREQLKDCSSAFDRQQEMLDRNAEQIATLREQLSEKKNTDSGVTHWAGCSESGARHYKCALLEISRLRDTVTDLRVKLEAAKQETEIQKVKAEKHYELGTEYFDLYTKAVKGQLKEKNGG
ncbi:hypothetical protein UFOVP1025_6 [uncultured Caudovirales phage]|uniref:Uncharacterized protein n=1 Tax=uncultured Caudovirales phage TaxID=2100421 RepID=A0A6J5P4F6_9CAUD|nr:hypothetical protein UFOVP852_28 [uncultured Caudovirales phage]CAB4173354.1 hypothetical protein UFOVP948_51 [uncultured Caudovirales phage]CAB4178833.1 hypothetical protein UFOVP1025_6 [uncultured Caudovirales phage]CAB4219843.1 hypothetical protein UFOVP1628_9 [uncultured Caudovirales phage]